MMCPCRSDDSSEWPQFECTGWNRLGANRRWLLQNIPEQTQNIWPPALPQVVWGNSGGRGCEERDVFTSAISHLSFLDLGANELSSLLYDVNQKITLLHQLAFLSARIDLINNNGKNHIGVFCDKIHRKVCVILCDSTLSLYLQWETRLASCYLCYLHTTVSAIYVPSCVLIVSADCLTHC